MNVANFSTRSEKMRSHPYFSEVYAQNLDVALNQIQKTNLDWFHVIDGVVGSGKSTLATETCLYIDPTFTEDRVAYTFDEIQSIVRDLGDPPESVGKAILLDEAAESQSANDSQRTENKDIGKFFLRIRKKRLFFCNCIAYIWKLQDISRLRAMSLAHCEFSYDTENSLLKQGNGSFYSIFKIPAVLKTKEYETPDFTFLFKAAPTDLWDKIQNKNYKFLDETDENAILKTKRLNKYEIDVTIVKALNVILGPQESCVIYTTTINTALARKYGENQAWNSSKYASHKLSSYGLQRYSGDPTRRSAYILTRDGLGKLKEALNIKPEPTTNIGT